MAIEVTNLRLSYGSHEAVRGVSFRVEPGVVCGYLGPNGAGKSSTVKVLTGILRPTSGSAQICGFDVELDKLEAQRKLGYVPEGAGAYPLLTATEFLELVEELYELPRAAALDRRRFLLDRFELADAQHRPIATLSKGQRQRLVILSALLHEPEVLILDEPLSGLDADAARTMKEILSGLARSGSTVLFCSHYLEIVERLCDRVVILNEGEVVADAPTAELVAGGHGGTLESVFAQVTGAVDGDAEEIVAALRSDGAAPEAAAAADGSGKRSKRGKGRGGRG